MHDGVAVALGELDEFALAFVAAALAVVGGGGVAGLAIAARLALRLGGGLAGIFALGLSLAGLIAFALTLCLSLALILTLTLLLSLALTLAFLSLALRIGLGGGRCALLRHGEGCGGLRERILRGGGIGFGGGLITGFGGAGGLG